MAETVSSIRGEISLEDKGWKSTLDASQQAARQFSIEGDRMTASCSAFMKALDDQTPRVKKTAEALRQETAFTRELAAAKLQAAQLLSGEGKLVADVSAKYHQLSSAERAELIEVRQSIAAHQAQEQAIVTAAKKIHAEQEQAVKDSERAAAAAGREGEKAAAAAERSAARQVQAYRTIGMGMQQFGRAMTVAVTGPLVALGAGLLKSGVDVQEGMRQIQVTTGATGPRLEALKASFLAIGKTVPQSLAEVGQALGTVATRTGLTGPALTALTHQLLTLQRITGADLAETLRLSTRAFGDWGISVKAQGAALDLVFRASQLTGIGFDRLQQVIVRYGAPLRQMGFSFGEAAALIGKFEKEGVNTELVLGGLRIALTRMAKAGVTDASSALKQMEQQIRSAGSAAQANAIAVKLFGARVGPDMAAAIREGRLEIGKLLDQMKASHTTIEQTGQQTLTVGQRFAMLGRQVEIAVQPLAQKLITVLEQLTQILTTTLVPALKSAADWFTKLSPGMQGAIVAALGFTAALGPALILLGRVVSSIPGFIAGMAAIQGALAGVTIAEAAATAGISLLVAGIGLLSVAYLTNFHGWRDDLIDGLRLVGEFVSGLAQRLKGALDPRNWFKGGGVSSFTDLINQELLAAGGRVMARRATAAAAPYTGPPTPLLPAGPQGDRLRAMYAANEQQRAAQELFKRQQAGGAPNAADWMSRLGKTGQQKLTPEQKEQLRFTEELASARARLAELLAGEGNIAAQVAARYHLLDRAQRDNLVTVLKRVKQAELEGKFDQELIAAKARLAEVTAGEGDIAAQVALKYHTLSAARRADLVAVLEQTKAAQAVESAHMDLLKSRAAFAGGGNINEQSVALETFGQKWEALSKKEQTAVEQIVRFKVESKKTEEAGQTISDFTRQITELQLQYQALTGASEVERFTAAELHKNWGTLSEDAKILAERSYFVKAAIDQLTKAREAEAESVRKRIEVGHKLLDEQQKEREGWQEMAGTLGRPQTALEALRLQQQRYKQEADRAFEGDKLAAFDKGMKRLSGGWKELSVDAKFFLDSFTRGTENVFQNMFTHLYEHDFKGFFRSVIDGVKQMFQQIAAEYLASKLTDLIFGRADQQGKRGGGLIDVIGAAIGGLFGGHGKQMGGSFAAGERMLVGERGPELAVFNRSGTIIPNHQLAGAGGGNITIQMHVSTPDVAGFRRNQDALLGDAHRAAERIRRRNG